MAVLLIYKNVKTLDLLFIHSSEAGDNKNAFSKENTETVKMMKIVDIRVEL